MIFLLLYFKWIFEQNFTLDALSMEPFFSCLDLHVRMHGQYSVSFLAEHKAGIIYCFVVNYDYESDVWFERSHFWYKWIFFTEKAGKEGGRFLRQDSDHKDQSPRYFGQDVNRNTSLNAGYETRFLHSYQACGTYMSLDFTSPVYSCLHVASLGKSLTSPADC